MQIIANDGIIIISFWNYIIFFCCGSLLPINAPRINIISFHILIKIGFVCASYAVQNQNNFIIIILVLRGRAPAPERPWSARLARATGAPSTRSPVRRRSQCTNSCPIRTGCGARSRRGAIRAWWAGEGLQWALWDQMPRPRPSAPSSPLAPSCADGIDGL